MTTDKAPRYSVIFDGELIAGASRKAVLDNLVHLTNLSAEELRDRVFSVKPVVLAQTGDRLLAEQYELKFRQAGLSVSSAPYDTSHDDIVNAELSFGHYAPLESQESAPNFILNSTETATEIHQPNGRYRVVFSGQLLNGYSREAVVPNLCSLTNSSMQQVLDNIFSAIPVVLCQTDDMELARAYHQGFESAGLKVQLTLGALQPNADIGARSELFIRDDKPTPLPEKKIQRFTYALYCLAGLAFLCWLLIYLIFDSYLKSDPQQVYQVALVPARSIEAKPAPVEKTKPAEAKKPSPSKPAAKKAAKPEKKPVEKAQAKQKLPAKKEKPATPSNEPKAPATPEAKKNQEKVNKQQQQLSNEYHLQLLNWFAQFQQQNPLPSRYVEGEITLRLTIDRNGEIKNIKVLKSTSEELQRIVVMQLRKAGHIPGMPAQIDGKEYSFDLPLRYRFR